MTCNDIIERLPWLLNGSLEPSEAREVLRHLASCASCREELSETARVWSETQSHPPAEVIADYALGLALTDFPRAVLEAHLEHCASCQREVALAGEPSAEDRGGAAAAPWGTPRHDGTPIPSLRKDAGPWRAFAAAASLVAVGLATALVLQTGRGSELVPNIAVMELLPAEDLVRSASGSRTQISKGDPVLLLLRPVRPAVPGTSYRAEIGDGSATIYTAFDLTPSQHGDFTLLLPTTALPLGAIEVKLLGPEGEAAGTYSLSLVQRDQP